MTDSATITRRSRNLGYGWETQPEQRYNSQGQNYLVVKPTTELNVQGGLRSVRQEIQHRAKVCSGGVDYSEALFVGGRKVTGVWSWIQDGDPEAEDMDEWLRGHEGWVRPSVSQILRDLETEGEVKVRLA